MKGDQSALSEAKEFLANLLSDGPRSVKEIETEACDAGLALRTIQTARS